MSFPTPSLKTLGSFVFELCCGQTDRQTDRQTDSKVLPTPTDRAKVVNKYATYGLDFSNSEL